MRLIPLVLFALLSACAVAPPEGRKPVDKVIEPVPPRAVTAAPPRLDGRTAVRNFVAVIDQIEPVAEAVCRRRAPQRNCDFLIVVDDRPGLPPNAYQTVNDDGQPIIAFSVPLIAEARNRDELAFILSHEAAHHIAGHLQLQRRAASIGATIFGNLAGIGGTPETVADAQRLGAALGARRYSKQFELDADALGAEIALLAGYDPLRGAAFFARIPDPGESFLSTHPANAERVATVRRVVAGF